RLGGLDQLPALELLGHSLSAGPVVGLAGQPLAPILGQPVLGELSDGVPARPVDQEQLRVPPRIAAGGHGLLECGQRLPPDTGGGFVPPLLALAPRALVVTDGVVALGEGVSDVVPQTHTDPPTFSASASRRAAISASWRRRSSVARRCSSACWRKTGVWRHAARRARHAPGGAPTSSSSSASGPRIRTA